MFLLINNKADTLSNFQFQELLALCPEAPSRLHCTPFSNSRLTLLSSYLETASKYMRFGMAKSTLKVYDSAWSYFSLFCTAFTVPVFPINIEVFCALIVHCVNTRKLQPPSIKATLAGIQFHLHCRDLSSISLFQHSSISLLIKGISKAYPGKKDKRLPLTLPLLHKMWHHLRLGVFGSYLDILSEAVVLTASYGFLRQGEFTCKSLCFDPNHDLTISDISMLKHQFTLTLKHSKMIYLIKVSLLLYSALIVSFALSFPCLGT